MSTASLLEFLTPVYLFRSRLVAENKIKYKLWGSFYLITVVYIYLTRILIQFLKVALPFQYVQWLVELLNEVITLGFYATIG